MFNRLFIEIPESLESEEISFILYLNNNGNKKRISFENATTNETIDVLSSDNGFLENNYIISEKEDSVSGKIFINKDVFKKYSSFSLYANIEDLIDGSWQLVHIVAYSIQVPSKVNLKNDHISLDSSFVTYGDVFRVYVKSDPFETLRFSFNDKNIEIKTNQEGKASYSLRTENIFDNKKISSIIKLPIKFSKKSENYFTEYDAGIFVNIVPDSMSVLQSTNDISSPGCVIFDPLPGSGLKLESLDSNCFEGSVVGDFSVFDSDSYKNSHVGFCSDIKKAEIDPNDSCRIYNRLSSDILPDGTILSAFSSQSNTDNSLASRIYLAKSKSSLKYRGNPVRNGTLLKPYLYYHSVYISDVKKDDIIGIEFRLSNGISYEIRYTVVSDDQNNILYTITNLLNENDSNIFYDIKSLNFKGRIDIYSNYRFTIVVNSYRSDNVVPETSVSAELNTNQIIEMIVDDSAIDDAGSYVVFLNNSIGYQSYEIANRSFPNIIRLQTTKGVNNSVGPTITENQYCQSFVVVDTDNSSAINGIESYMTLPFIKDSQQRKVPLVNPSIASSKDYINGNIYVYVVAQGIVDDICQLFLYSFSLGSNNIDTGEWIQLTYTGENHNPHIVCDKNNNLHITWESDREGPSQIYYSVLGSVASIRNNQAFVSAIDKNYEYKNSSILSINEPKSIQTTDAICRLIGNNGKASIVSYNSFAVSGNVRSDESLICFDLLKDEYGYNFDMSWDQMSYQVSFDLNISGLQEDTLSDFRIEQLFNEWKSSFSSVNNYKYKYNNNIYTVNKTEKYYENFIPICGSYKINEVSDIFDGYGSFYYGDKEVAGYSDVSGGKYISHDEYIKISHKSDLKHFVLGLMPEKVKFKADNTETFSEYCSRNNILFSNCDSYEMNIEKEYYTGFYKLCMIISSATNESKNDIYNKDFNIVRLIGDPISFKKDEKNNFKICVHYSRSSEEYIQSSLNVDRFADSEKMNFFGDIFMLVNNEPVFGHSFVSDFSDEEARFHIGFGFPAKDGFVVNDSLPYNANNFEDANVTMTFTDVAVGPHSVFPDNTHMYLSSADRNVEDMVIPLSFDNNNLVLNGDFETATVSPGSFLSLDENSQYLYGWDIIGGINYAQDIFKPYRRNRSAWLYYGNSLGKNDFSFSSEGWNLTIPHYGDLYGAVAGSYGTIYHERHSSYDDGYIYSYNLGSGVYYWESPASYIKNASSSYNGVLFFRIKGKKPTSVSSAEHYDVMIESNSGDIIGINIEIPDTEDWLSYSVPLNVEAGWKICTYVVYSVSTPWLDPVEEEIVNVLSDIKRVLIRSTYDTDVSQYVYLDSVAFVPKSGISQQVKTDIGERYYLKFAVAPVPVLDVYGKTKRLRVLVGGVEYKYDFDISNSYVLDIEDSSINSKIKWYVKEIEFTASSDYTEILFINDSGISEYSVCVDYVSVVKFDESINSLYVPNIYKKYGIEEKDFYLHFGSYNYKYISNIPVTLPSTYINKNPHISIDDFCKSHIVWESNRNGYWDIYYSGNRYRYLPFRFESQLSSSKSNSLNPSIAIDKKGRRCVVWHDNRSGVFQIYSALNHDIDSDYIDKCKINEASDLAREISDLDPYDSYGFLSEVIGCNIEFDFDPPANAYYDFSVVFYDNFSKSNILKIVKTSESIDGWFADNVPFSYNGLNAQKNTSVSIKYNINDNSLVGKVLFVEILYQSREINDILNSSSEKVSILNKSPNIDFSDGQMESSSVVFAVTEYSGSSPSNFSSISTSDINNVDNNTIDVDFGSNNKLLGCLQGEKINSVYIHFDPSGNAGSTGYVLEDVVLKLNEPLVSILWSKNDLLSSDDLFGIEGVLYPERDSIDIQPFTQLYVSDDRLTVSFKIKSYYNRSSCMRLLTSSSSVANGTTSFSFFCPNNQPEKCSIDVNFTNTYPTSKNVHFRITAYTDSSMSVAAMSDFSMNNPLNWICHENSIQYSGIEVQAGESISIVYNPNILPFDYQNFKQVQMNNYLYCGTNYYIKIESFIDGYFQDISSNQFICLCDNTSSYVVNEYDDSRGWLCSGNGRDDIKISSTNSVCIHPNVVSSLNNLFYISWQDYRYYNKETPSNHDYFFAIYDMENDVAYSSANSSFDRRITEEKDEEKILFNHNTIVDQFQNINFVFSDKNSIFYKNCSTGCIYQEVIPETEYPCMFTDTTFTNSYYNVGGSPNRYVDQYQKIRIHKNFVSFSTYKDLNSPISVIDDCFIMLDIIGVPGTYAYRLKNEDSDRWSEWIPIDSNLPDQESDSTDSQKERSFFKAYFIDNERFLAPWICSSGNGLKRICCEILTYFGKTEMFCCDFMAIYDNIRYSMYFYYDKDFTKELPIYNSFYVASNNKTDTSISDSMLSSITESTSSVEGFYVKIVFEDADKIQRIYSMKNIPIFEHLDDFSIDVLQQGINDYVNLSLEKVSDSIFRCFIPIYKHDGLYNSDGLAYIKINIPGQCYNKSVEDINSQIEYLLNYKNLDQKITIYNNMTLFKEKYNTDDITNSFGDNSYYSGSRFESNQSVWTGGYISSGDDSGNSGGGDNGSGGGSGDSGGSGGDSGGGSSGNDSGSNGGTSGNDSGNNEGSSGIGTQ